MAGPSDGSFERFERIRPEALERLIEGRAALHLGLGALSPEVARSQIQAILDRVGAHLAAPDPARQRGYMGRWVAYHLGEGFSPENLVHSVVTTGDVLVQVARRRLPSDRESALLVRDLGRTTHAMISLVVDVLGAELARLAPPRGTKTR